MYFCLLRQRDTQQRDWKLASAASLTNGGLDQAEQEQ